MRWEDIRRCHFTNDLKVAMDPRGYRNEPALNFKHNVCLKLKRDIDESNK